MTTLDRRSALRRLIASLVGLVGSSSSVAAEGLVPRSSRQGSRITDGKVYYVATTGSDGNAGSPKHPWRTLQHAADAMAPGDAVYVRGGVYRESVRTMRSGAPSREITFAAFPKERPVIEGSGVEADNGIFITHDHVRFTGLEVANWRGNAIWVERAGHFRISDCELHHVTYGLGITDGAHDFTIDRVLAHNFDLYGFDVSPANGRSCNNGTFNDCIAHTGRDPEQNVDGFALGHGKQHGFALNRCLAHDVYDGFDISARDTRLSRCSAHNCGNSGYKLWQDAIRLVNCLSYANENANVELDWGGAPGSVTLQNCTLVGAGSFNIWIENSADALCMLNCILAGGNGIGLAFEQRDASRYSGSHNLFHSDTGRAITVGYEDEFSTDRLELWRAYSGQDAHSRTAQSLDDIFVNAAAFDLHLAASSPARDGGMRNGAPKVDYDGNARPRGSDPDIGAYER